METALCAVSPTDASPTRSQRIQALNDQLRATGRGGGRVVLTAGIAALPATRIADIVAAVALFDDFNSANDPYGEHDFALLTVQGHMVVWKIDYYDVTLTWGSDDPSDPDITTRVLTMMLAEEY